MTEKNKGSKKLVLIVTVVVAVIAIGVISWKVTDQKRQSNNPESTLIKDYF